MHGYIGGNFLWQFGFCMILFMMFCWWRDIIREGTFEGQHTSIVQIGLKMGMLLFIVSEIMFFFAFFWAFFHSSFNPSPAIGGVWPPAFLTTLDPWKVPLLNTFLLLSSGASVTWAHHAILAGNRQQGLYSLIITIFLAVLFTGFQALEYIEAPFTIADSVYGSTFFLATGFHGFHVFSGVIINIVMLIMTLNNTFEKKGHYLMIEKAGLYWHFVDLVWVFVFTLFYLV